MLAKMIDKIVSLKETKIFEIGGQTYADAVSYTHLDVYKRQRLRRAREGRGVDPLGRPEEAAQLHRRHRNPD